MASVETELVERLEGSNQIREVTESEEYTAPTSPRYDRALFLKLMSAGFSFFVAGINDGSTGAMIPYFMRQYEINTTIVSSMLVKHGLMIRPSK